MKTIATKQANIASTQPVLRRKFKLKAEFIYVVISILSPLCMLLLWFVLTAQHIFSTQILVPPLTVWQTFISLIQSGELSMHLSDSLYRLFIGFGLASLLGITFGILYATVTSFRNYSYVLFNVLYQIPVFVLIPIFILIFGIGEVFKILLIIKACFFPIALATSDAVKSIPKQYIELGKTYQFKTISWLKLIILPCTLPLIISGLRIALGRAWLILVAVELLAAGTGIGQMMEMSRQMLRLDIVMVGVLMTGVVGFSLDKLLRLVEQRLPYDRSQTQGEKHV